MADRRSDGPPGAAVGSPAEPAGAWLSDCPAQPPKRRDTQQAKRADGILCALSVLRSGRFAFGHGTVGFPDTALCTFRSRSGSIHGAAWSVVAERRRNEASSSREGGGRHAVRWWLAFGVGCWRGMRAVRASVSWPARPTGCANGAERSAAPLVGGDGTISLQSYCKSTFVCLHFCCSSYHDRRKEFRGSMHQDVHRALRF